MPGWTNEQEAAITARGASVTVSAAAGSGKTSVLVERLIRLLADEEEKWPAERMVVVTFTQDAAGEVRHRLNEALLRRIPELPENAWLRRQQTMLQSAKISTIHSFCFDLLREHAAELDLSAGFRVMEESEENALRAETAARVVEALSSRAAEDADAAAMQQLLYQAFCDRDDKPLETLILDMYALTVQNPFGEYLLDDAAARCESDETEAAAMELLGDRISEICTLYEKGSELMRDIGTPLAKEEFQDECRQVKELYEAWASGDLTALADSIEALKKSSRFRVPTAKGQAEQGAMVRALRNHALKCCENLKKWVVPLRYAEDDLRRHGALLRAAAELNRMFSEMLTAEKRERAALGFDDAMRLTLSLLARREEDGSITRTELAEQLSEQYDLIMIDEFQDADNSQDLIFRMLSRGGSAERYGSNLFVVGDSKQCIYRFRNADPSCFYRAMREAKPYAEAAPGENTVIHLNRNFRSAGETVDFINHIFSQLMTERIGEIAYDSTQELVCGAAYPALHRPVELLLLEQAGRGGAEADSDAPDEPAVVARAVRRHLDAGTPVRGADGSLRPCRYGDFLILLRTGTQMPKYVRALQAEGIPVCSIEQKKYLHAHEIMILTDLLRAADNPQLDIPMASVMISPLGGFTLDDLTELRVRGGGRTLWQTMRSMQQHPEKQEEPVPEALMQRIDALLSLLESLRLNAVIETPEQIIRRVYAQTDFLGMMQLSDGGAQRKANLRALLGYARRYEESSGGGLSGFLRYLDAILARQEDLQSGGIPAGSENVVTLKTIHKSKGLEAPFVILANTKNPFSNEDSKKQYQYHRELGIGFRLHDPEHYTVGKTLPYLTVEARNKQEMVSEELRLLYVALTRAKEYLMISVTHSSKYAGNLADFAAEQTAFGGQTDLLSGSVHNMLDWVMMALVRNPSCEALRRDFGLECATDSAQPMLNVVFTRTHAAGSDAEADADAEAPEPDQALVQRMAEHCAWQYDSRLAELTAKYGVSELVKQEDFSAALSRPRFMQDEKRLTGSERGTALHTFLQYADFEAAAADVNAEAERLREAGRLTARQLEAVRGSTVSAFFETPLYARIRQAKQVLREKKFTVRLRDLHLTGPLEQLGRDYAGTEGMVIGIMDLVFEEEDGLVLVDYKTDRIRDPQELIGEYSEQLRIYAEALRLLTERPVKECILYSIHLNRVIPLPAE